MLIVQAVFDQNFLFKYLIIVEEMSESPTPEPSPELTKRSWFGSLMSTDKDETYTIIVKGKPLASIKADLIHAFLSVSPTDHTNHISFRSLDGRFSQHSP